MTEKEQRNKLALELKGQKVTISWWKGQMDKQRSTKHYTEN